MRFAEARYCFRIPVGKLAMRRNMFYFVLARNALLLLAIMPAALAVAAPLQQPQARVPLEGILNSNITACAFAKTNTNFNWRYGTIFNPNPRCWLYGVQFSGWAQATPPSQQERNVVLLTSRHGLTCAHAFGSPPGTLVVMLGTNGVKYTNAIASTIGGLSDLLLVAPRSRLVVSPYPEGYGAQSGTNNADYRTHYQYDLHFVQQHGFQHSFG